MCKIQLGRDAWAIHLWKEDLPRRPVDSPVVGHPSLKSPEAALRHCIRAFLPQILKEKGSIQDALFIVLE